MTIKDKLWLVFYGGEQEHGAREEYSVFYSVCVDAPDRETALAKGAKGWGVDIGRLDATEVELIH